MQGDKIAMSDWPAMITAKRQDRTSKIPTEWVLPQAILDQVHENSSRSAFDIFRDNDFLTKDEVRLTEAYDAQDLSSAIVQGKVTALDVCKAFCKRAAIAHQLTNCATEIFFDEALERARFLDDYLLKEKKPYGPLHGVPISVKDCYNVKGQATTIGFVSYLGKPKKDKNSPIVDVLLENGALIYLKTNVPQTMMTMDSVNNVFGRTLNPRNPRFTAGGSSGGEGALIALRGSLLGVGTDIGGSIRAPSLCNGVYGFKPTANRIPHGEWESGMRAGTPGFVSSAGPLATSAADLTYFCKTVIQSAPWKKDPSALGGGWRDVPRKEKLRIGLFLGDNNFPLTPPVTRALKTAAAALEKAGHAVTALSCFPSCQEGLEIAARLLMMDNDQTLVKHILAGDEQPIAALSYASPATVVEAKEYTLDDLWDANTGLIRYREKLAAVWSKHDLDIVLCPGARTPATPHDNYGMPVYTVIWNLLNFPASIIPFLEVDSSLDSVDGYDASTANGLPLAIQAVGWIHQDEEVLMATEVIDETLRIHTRSLM